MTIWMTRCFALLVALSVTAQANATDFVLTNGLGTAAGNTDETTGLGFQLEVFAFNGVNFLFQEDLFYQFGPDGPAIKVNSLPILSETITATTVDVTYDGGTFELDWGIDLTSSNMLGEWITIRPRQTLAEFRLFEYTDFDVPDLDPIVDPWLNDDATLVAPGHIRQRDVISGLSAEVLVHSPVPDGWEIDVFPILMDKIVGAGPNALSNTDNLAAPDDNTFAFQWDTATLTPGQTVEIHKWKSIVPEPCGIALAGWALLGLALVSQQRARTRGSEVFG